MIARLSFSILFAVIISQSYATQTSGGTLIPSNDLSRRLEAAMKARESGDLGVIGRASGQVLSLALAELAKLRLDQGAYGESIKLCQESLEFEDVPETRVELAIASLYAKRPAEAVEQASEATERAPENALAWMIKGEALLQNKDYAGATLALGKSIEQKPDAEPIYALSLAYLGAGENQKATNSFSQFLALTGDIGWSRVLVGRAYLDQKLPREAELEFQNALRLDSRTPTAHYFWALTLLQANEWNPTPEVRSHLQEELKLNPRHFSANYLLGYFASNEKDYDESDHYLRLAAEISPSVPETWMFLGMNAQGRKSSRLAESYFRKAISLAAKGTPKEHPSIRRAYFVLGRILLYSGRKKEGEELLQKARELQVENLTDNQIRLAAMQIEGGTSVTGATVAQLTGANNRNLITGLQERNLNGSYESRPMPRQVAGLPQDPAGKMERHLYAVLGSSFNDLATAEALQERYALAYRHYREAARWDSRIPGVERNLGLAAFFVGEHAEAIGLLTKAIALAPEDAHARAVLGLAYFATKNYGKTVETITPLADRAAQDTQLGFAWAKSLAETGHRKSAAQALEALETMEKAGAGIDGKELIQFGHLWEYLDKTERAEQSFRRALLIEPTSAEAKCALGTALTHLSRPEEAAELFRSVLADHPDNPEARRGLERALIAVSKAPEPTPRLAGAESLPSSLLDDKASSPKQLIEIDTNAPAHPFPHFWEEMFGSGRAILSLRDDYRKDLRETRRITGFEYVRFHAIFHDEAGFYDEDKDGKPIYNFSYVDQIYDGLLENHVRPFIELSFMPKKLASDPNALHAFWYKQNVAPPKDWNKWEQLIEAFTRHLVDRYGLDEVAQWYFEVWNEPNLDFWAGDPREATYYELYDRAAHAIKRVSRRLRVGGPSTAQAAWVDRFLAHCKEKNVPVDFASTHVYGNDRAEDVFGTHENIPRTQMVCRAVKKVHDQIAASPYPSTPLIWSEFNASYMNEPAVTDTAFMGPWMADTIRQCDGLTQMMSYWTFSDVFEEQGVVKTPFYGGFGLLAERRIPKAAFNDFALLHQLGDMRLDVNSDSALVTRRKDGALAIAVWNLFLPEEAGSARTFTLHFKGLSGAKTVRVTIVDKEHGSPLPAWEKMGRPAFPTLAQIDTLRKAGALPPASQEELEGNSLTLTLQPHALALIEISK